MNLLFLCLRKSLCEPRRGIGEGEGEHDSRFGAKKMGEGREKRLWGKMNNPFSHLLEGKGSGYNSLQGGEGKVAERREWNPKD